MEISEEQRLSAVSAVKTSTKPLTVPFAKVNGEALVTLERRISGQVVYSDCWTEFVELEVSMDDSVSCEIGFVRSRTVQPKPYFSDRAEVSLKINGVPVARINDSFAFVKKWVLAKLDEELTEMIENQSP